MSGRDVLRGPRGNSSTAISSGEAFSSHPRPPSWASSRIGAWTTHIKVGKGFSKVKRLLRKAESRMRETLVEAIGTATSAVTAKDARGFFEHCGHRAMVQSF